MKYKWKRVLAVVFLFIIVAGWYVTVCGIGPVKPIQDRMKLGLDIKGGVYVVMEAKTDLKGEELQKAMEQTQAVIEERVNQMGLAEPVVTIEGDKRIRVELPGAEDAQEAIEQIGKTAQLQFALADGTIVLDGGSVKDASVTTDQDSAGYAVALEFDSKGADAFYEATVKAYSGAVQSSVEGVNNDAIMILLDNQIISAPSVNKGPISGGKCTITGNFSQEEASNLTALIKGGALPLTLEEVNSSVQSAKIGYNALEMSVYAGLIGLALILILMIVAYRGLGVVCYHRTQHHGMDGQRADLAWYCRSDPVGRHGGRCQRYHIRPYTRGDQCGQDGACCDPGRFQACYGYSHRLSGDDADRCSDPVRNRYQLSQGLRMDVHDRYRRRNIHGCRGYSALCGHHGRQYEAWKAQHVRHQQNRPGILPHKKRTSFYSL